MWFNIVLKRIGSKVGATQRAMLIYLLIKLLLLLLSRFSRVRLGATPRTAAHQAPLSLGFSWVLPKLQNFERV